MRTLLGLALFSLLLSSCSSDTASSLALSGLESELVVGNTETIQVTALDSSGGAFTGYLGTVHFTSTDATAQVPADYTFVAGDAGTHFFNVIFGMAGSITLSVADTGTPALTAQQTTTLSVPPLKALSISTPDSPAPGQAFDVLVEAIDVWNSPDSFYTGTVHFSSSDPTAALPPDYTFTAGDVGQHLFPAGATVNAAGATVSVTDTSASLTGSMVPLSGP